MSELIPAILAKDEYTFRKHLGLMETEFPVVQIDLMDGAFVPDRSWFDAAVYNTLKTPAKFELHLMAMDPKWYLDQLKTAPNITRVIWHVESKLDHAALIARCRTEGKEIGLAIKPTTPLEDLMPWVNTINEVLVMGAEPGTSGQKLQPQTIERAKEIHSRWPNLVIGFDIGVSKDTIPSLLAAGVTRFCSASAIFETEQPLSSAQSLKALLN